MTLTKQRSPSEICAEVGMCSAALGGQLPAQDRAGHIAGPRRFVVEAKGQRYLNSDADDAKSMNENSKFILYCLLSA